MIQQETEISLRTLIHIILKKWWLVLLVTCLGLAFGGGYAYLKLDDMYTAKSSMIVQVSNTGSDSIYTNLLTGQKLVNTYAEIVKSNVVLSTLKTNIDTDLSVSQLQNMIQISNVNESLIIQLSVTSTDAVLSQTIANEIVAIVQNLSLGFENLDNVQILDTATLPVNPSGPNRMLYIVFGLLLGGMIGVALVLIIEFSDKNIKNTQDIEQVLGIRLLGVVSEYSLDAEVIKNA